MCIRDSRATGQVIHYSSKLAGNFHIPNDYIHCIFADHQHTIWLGTRDGLMVYDNKLKRFVRPDVFFNNKSLPSFAGLRINRVIQDREFNYWVATHDGLYKMQRNGFMPEHYYAGAIAGFRISSNLVYALLEDRDGAIWVGTINGLDAVSYTHLDVYKRQVLAGVLVVLLIYRIKADRMKKTEIDHQLVLLEQKALQSMMNPHFIFNSLGSIQNYLLRNKSDEAVIYLSLIHI